MPQQPLPPPAAHSAHTPAPGALQPEYGAPQPEYGAPPPASGAPPSAPNALPLAYGAPPPAYGAPPPAYGAPTPGQTVVYFPAPRVIAQNPHFGDSPVSINCIYCDARMVTMTTYTSGAFAWLVCGFLIIIGLWFGCCLIPFCVDGCKDVVHTCPNCRQQVGRHNRM